MNSSTRWGSWAAAALALCFVAAWARAQEAPAGNAHPQDAPLQATLVANPFGQPVRESPFTVDQKLAFAQSVDLAPLRNLAVYHNGRVKILGTLAEEVVRSIVGRRDYFDLRPNPDGKSAKKLKHDPLFTFFDLLIDPAYYADKPLIHIQYLPLRRAYVDSAFESEAERELWMARTRLSPRVAFSLFQTMATQHGTDPQVAQGLEHVRSVFTLLEQGFGLLRMVAPVDPAGDWEHVSSLGDDSKVVTGLRALAEAWRSGDAVGASGAARAVADALPKINEQSYPTASRRLEAAYNAARPFEWGAWAYCLSFVTLLLALGTGRRWLVVTGVGLLALATALHATGFGLRWFIAERLPIQNQFESMTGLALGGVLVGFVLMVVRRQWLFGAAAAGVGFLTLLGATQAPIPGEAIGREAAILNTSVLLKYHVSTVLVSYGLITLGFFLSLIYLWTHYAARRRGAEAASLAAGALGLDETDPKGPARVLADLDRATMTVLQLAFWTLGVGILLGAWWADHSWGRWWAFDPKETWALVTWIVYLIVVHVRVAGGRNRALVTAWLSVAGFIVMLWTYFGVNLILPGLHAYA